MPEVCIAKIIETSKTVQELLLKVLQSDFLYKTGSYAQPLNSYDRDIVSSKINMLLQAEMDGECVLLLRGENKKRLKGKLIKKLNSNDSLYDGLFLVDDKAKNYLEKTTAIPHPIKRITDTSKRLLVGFLRNSRRLEKV